MARPLPFTSESAKGDLMEFVSHWSESHVYIDSLKTCVKLTDTNRSRVNSEVQS